MVTNETLDVCETVLLHYFCLDFSARHDLLDNVKTDGQSLSRVGKKICMLHWEGDQWSFRNESTFFLGEMKVFQEKTWKIKLSTDFVPVIDWGYFVDRYGYWITTFLIKNRHWIKKKITLSNLEFGNAMHHLFCQSVCPKLKPLRYFNFTRVR